MAFDSKSLDDYVDVAERMTEFYDRYPEGSLRAADPARPWEQATVTGYDRDGHEVTQTFIVYTALAFRAPDDAAPGVGTAWEVFPGRTPYTRGSEVMNAETSAWGRAMAALGIATKKGIASRQEVRLARERDGLPVNADGSLSRSRTTDEQKAAAGVMTSAQQAEHTALQPKRGRPAQRLAAVPDDDPFYDQPPPGRDDGKPGTITRAQQTAYHAKFGVLGVRDRDDKLRHTENTLGLPAGSLKSSSDLSRHQAGALLEALEELARAGT